MRSAKLLSLTGLFFLSTFCSADTGGYEIKSVKAVAPKDLKDSIRKEMGGKAIQFRKKGGDLIAEIWLRDKLPAESLFRKQDKKTFVYKDLRETTVLGAVRFAKEWKDYRGQKVKAGVYSIRLGFQPQDGDHMGTSPFPNFVVLVAAKFDPKIGEMPTRGMIERSMASISTSHPAILLLFPNKKPGDEIKLVEPEYPKDHLVLTTSQVINLGENKSGTLGLSLALVGHAAE